MKKSLSYIKHIPKVLRGGSQRRKKQCEGIIQTEKAFFRTYAAHAAETIVSIRTKACSDDIERFINLNDDWKLFFCVKVHFRIVR